ncbi:flagellar filament capping protein FliD [Actinoplanes sp. CA-051413]|uniref:flagellar filament capping protein FliD n=1 Tax=Actinoplanes sp. CA-051413 TaxID=3239899 RepID=UPI003D969180
MASIDGLISGMSTTDTINQLMQVEAAPQTALKSKVSTVNKVVTAYQSVNSRLSSLAAAAGALGKSDTWGGMKATSSSSAAAISAQSGASAGSLSFHVDQLAATRLQTFKDASVTSITDADAAPVMSNDSFDIYLKDGTKKPLTPTDRSLQAVVTAINGEAEAPYKASAVQIAPGRYTLQLTAKESGADAAAKIDNLLPEGLDLGSSTVTIDGRDAVLTVGEGNGAYAINSTTNTFADILPGVTVTAAKAQAPGDAPVTVDISADVEGIATKVQALVDNVNVVLNELASQSKIKSADAAAGPLVGDAAIRKLRQDILGAVSSGAPGLGANDTTASFKEVGISINRDGTLAFVKDAFLKTYKADPARAEKFFDSYTDVTSAKGNGTEGTFQPGFDTANGLGRKLEALALIASEGVKDPDNPNKTPQGTMQALMERNTKTISSLNDQVSEWDVRLELRRTALQKQFSSLEVALGKMQQQSSWLAGQLAGLG